MILKKLILQNFGLYKDKVEFDLYPSKRNNTLSPLILIGGKNGAGKTTFLEAIRFVLYGRRALGLGISQKEYDNYLISKINYKNIDQIAEITLNFEYVESGEAFDYEVTRKWYLESDKVIEHLEIRKNTEILSSVPKDEWSSFLLELIPIGVSQLFFFDGEKIQDIADDTNNDSLADAIKSLLGIDLIERLKTDLSIYLERNTSSDDNFDDKNSSNIQETLITAREKEKKLLHEIAKLKTTHQSLLNALEQKQQRFIAEGGEAALNYDQLKNKLSEVNKQLKLAQNELAELTNGLLPFLFAPNLLKKLKGLLSNVSETVDKNQLKEQFLQLLDNFKNETALQKAKWQTSHWDDLTNFLNKVDNKQDAFSHPALQEISDGSKTLKTINTLDTKIYPKAKSLFDKFNMLTLEKNSLESSISRAENGKISSIFSDLLEYEQKIEVSEKKLKTKEEDLKKVRWQILTLEREQNKLIEAQTNISQQNQQAELASKSIKVLIEFEEKLLNQKINQLRSCFISVFNSLLRKKNYLLDIDIDPKSFQTTLINKHSKEIPKNSLSAGEKQIYAISMLWALAQTSGRSLPMIIDTPLGRLDSEHRQNLVKNYFPFASHQTIILSTDTEIHEEYIKLLKGKISHTYYLSYDNLTEQTTITTGYFGLTEKENRIALQQA